MTMQYNRSDEAVETKEGGRTVPVMMCADHKEQLELLAHKRLQSASSLTAVNITLVQSEEDVCWRSFEAAHISFLLVRNLQILQNTASFDANKVCSTLHQPAGWPRCCRGCSK